MPHITLTHPDRDILTLIWHHCPQTPIFPPRDGIHCFSFPAEAIDRTQAEAILAWVHNSPEAMILIDGVPALSPQQAIDTAPGLADTHPLMRLVQPRYRVTLRTDHPDPLGILPNRVTLTLTPELAEQLQALNEAAEKLCQGAFRPHLLCQCEPLGVEVEWLRVSEDSPNCYVEPVQSTLRLIPRDEPDLPFELRVNGHIPDAVVTLESVLCGAELHPLLEQLRQVEMTTPEHTLHEDEPLSAMSPR